MIQISIGENVKELVVPMKVLILGLGRTGTAYKILPPFPVLILQISFKSTESVPSKLHHSNTITAIRAAMKELGYVDTYHMMSASIENPPHALMWRDAFAAKYDGIGTFTRKNWDQLLGHCQAVCDWPAVAFADELIAAYPEAKVVLKNRDVDSWHASTRKTVWLRVTKQEIQCLQYVCWAYHFCYPMLRKFFDCFFEGDFPGKGKEIYTCHYEHVRSIVPKENLLGFKVQDGWEPLCEFLGERVRKDTKFPFDNDNSDFVQRSKRRNRMQALNVLFRWFGMLLFFVGGWWALVYGLSNGEGMRNVS